MTEAAALYLCEKCDQLFAGDVCSCAENEAAVVESVRKAIENMEAIKYDNPVLNEREKTHGDYKDTARIAQQLKNASRDTFGYYRLSEVQAESLDLIFTKIARALSGDPNCKDTWDDIAGYANLVSERLK
jgi:hypothetical protein